MVENIDIQLLIKDIDFNSNDIQYYPPGRGMISLRESINREFFHGASSVKNIFITNGGVNALELLYKTLNTTQVLLPSYYWGAYLNIMKINKLKYSFYPGLEFLNQNAKSIKGATVMICDPNNPTGIKFDDNILIETIRHLNSEGIVVVFDSPYRRLFFEWEKDDFYKKLLEFENLIITDSFSKSVGLSGQRIGFIHCTDESFMDELAVNLLFSTNGINTFAQVLVEKILSTENGKKAASDFRKNTVEHITKNIEYLGNRQLLADQIYGEQKPWGIFVIVKLNYNKLFSQNIGSVPLNYFTKYQGIDCDNYTRICVSVPHQKFVRFFDRVEK